MSSQLSIGGGASHSGTGAIPTRSSFHKAFGRAEAENADAPDFQQEVEQASLQQTGPRLGQSETKSLAGRQSQFVQRLSPEEASYKRLAEADHKMAVLQKGLLDLRAKKAASVSDEADVSLAVLAQMGMPSLLGADNGTNEMEQSGLEKNLEKISDSSEIDGKKWQRNAQLGPALSELSQAGLAQSVSSPADPIRAVKPSYSTADQDVENIAGENPASPRTMTYSTRARVPNQEELSVDESGARARVAATEAPGMLPSPQSDGSASRRLENPRQATVSKEKANLTANSIKREVDSLPPVVGKGQSETDQRSLGTIQSQGQTRELNRNRSREESARESEELKLAAEMFVGAHSTRASSKAKDNQDQISGDVQSLAAAGLRPDDYTHNLDQLPSHLLAENGIDFTQTVKSKESRTASSRAGIKANGMNETSGGDFLSTMNLVKDQSNSDLSTIRGKSDGANPTEISFAGNREKSESGGKASKSSFKSRLENLAFEGNPTAAHLESRSIPIDTRTFNMIGNANATELPGQVVQGAGTRDRLSTDALLGISNQISRLTPQGGGEIRIRLKPENLGELTVRVITDGSRVGLQIRASDDRSKKIIEESINSLRDSLSSQSLTLSHVDLSTIASPTTQAGNEFNQDSNQFNSQNNLMDNTFQQGSQNFLGQNMNQSLNQGNRQNEFNDGSGSRRESRPGNGFRPNAAPLMGPSTAQSWNSSGRLDVMG